MHIGIVGGGQLARMMVLAGEPLGIDFIILDPAKDATAGQVTEQIIADYDDIDALTLLATKVDVITFDFENVPATALQHLESQCTVYPPVKALSISQDRLAEKTLFKQHGIETAPYAEINTLTDLHNALATLGTPCILKTRRFGYDGKGQFVIKDKSQADEAWQAINQQAAILEGFIDFDKEVSIITARSRSSDTPATSVYYPLSENQHQNGILHISRAPCDDEKLLEQAKDLLAPLIESLDYIGVLTVEFFVKGDQLIANEMAPRVHNSGHWTIEGAHCSQFENHVRAISNLPLGLATVSSPYSAMINFISQMPELKAICEIDSCHIHDYHKKPREGRKVGHATITADNKGLLEAQIKEILAIM